MWSTVENVIENGKSLKTIKEDRGRQKNTDKEETTWRTNVVTDEREENQRREAREEKEKRRRDDDGVDTEDRMEKGKWRDVG